MDRLRVILRSRSLSLPVVGLLSTAILVVAFGAVVALMLAPAVLLLMLLLHGIAPGVELIERLRRRCAAAHPRVVRCLKRRRLALVVRRVGRLLAAALAMRPPPAVSALPYR